MDGGIGGGLGDQGEFRIGELEHPHVILICYFTITSKRENIHHSHNLVYLSSLHAFCANFLFLRSFPQPPTLIFEQCSTLQKDLNI